MNLVLAICIACMSPTFDVCTLIISNRPYGSTVVVARYKITLGHALFWIRPLRRFSEDYCGRNDRTKNIYKTSTVSFLYKDLLLLRKELIKME